MRTMKREFKIARQWEQRFGHIEGGLMAHHCFLRRAVELARPDGGRVCLLVPEGLLARDNRGLPALRLAVAKECELCLVLTLPRVFKNNNARMAIVYLVRTSTPDANRRVLLAEVREKWRDSDGVKRTTDLCGELERIIDHFLETRFSAKRVHRYCPRTADGPRPQHVGPLRRTAESQ